MAQCGGLGPILSAQETEEGEEDGEGQGEEKRGILLLELGMKWASAHGLP